MTQPVEHPSCADLIEALRHAAPLRTTHQAFIDDLLDEFLALYDGRAPV